MKRHHLGLATAAAVATTAMAACGTTGVVASTASPKARAQADVAALFNRLHVPPGATSGNRPDGTPSALASPPQLPNTPNLVTATRWWTTSQSPAAALGWVNAHPPTGTTQQSPMQTTGPHGVEERTTSFTLPAIPGVVGTRELLVSTASLPGGRTVIRVDAEDIWLTPRPAAERIPAAKYLIVTAKSPRYARPPRILPGMGVDPTASPSAGPARLVVTDQATIGKIAEAVDGLPTMLPGTYSCPADTGGGITLTFESSASGPVVATVDAAATGCATVTVTTHGKKQPTLQGGGLIGHVESLLHVQWHFGDARTPGGGPLP
jgi:hypothetical protein